jgi:hypothetical protein
VFFIPEFKQRPAPGKLLITHIVIHSLWNKWIRGGDSRAGFGLSMYLLHHRTVYNNLLSRPAPAKNKEIIR